TLDILLLLREVKRKPNNLKSLPSAVKLVQRSNATVTRVASFHATRAAHKVVQRWLDTRPESPD
ncbi:hypothetical protein Ocin01_06079, partial [Orchesella cincta]